MLEALELDAALQVGSHKSRTEGQNHLPQTASHIVDDLWEITGITGENITKISTCRRADQKLGRGEERKSKGEKKKKQFEKGEGNYEAHSSPYQHARTSFYWISKRAIHQT